MFSWPDVGTRVTLRYRRPAGSVPPLTDAVGHLLAVDPVVRVRTKTGAVVEVAADDVVALRVLTDAPVRTSEIRALEHAAAAAWPRGERVWLEGWLLHAGNGINVAVPLDVSARADTIAAIAAWYERRGLTPRLAIPDRLLAVPPGLSGEHTERVLVRDVSASDSAEPDPSITLSARVDVIDGELIRWASFAFSSAKIIGRATAPLSDKAANLEADATYASGRNRAALPRAESALGQRGQLPAPRPNRRFGAGGRSQAEPDFGGEGGSDPEAPRGAGVRGVRRVRRSAAAGRPGGARQVGGRRAHLDRGPLSSLHGEGDPPTARPRPRGDAPGGHSAVQPQRVVGFVFPADKLIPTFRATLAGSGDGSRQADEHPDRRCPAPRRRTRGPFASPSWSQATSVCRSSRSGASRTVALFHEGGHAEHWAHTRTEIFEFQQLGGNATTEAYAFVLDDPSRTRGGSPRRWAWLARSSTRSSMPPPFASCTC